MAKIFGLDFGTTNSLVSVIVQEQVLSFTNELELPHPSVVWFKGHEVIVGREAREQMDSIALGVVGDFVRSPKRYLGSDSLVHVGGIAKSSAEIVAEVLRFLKNDCARRPERRDNIDRVVMTIPVNASGKYRRALREAALMAGIRIHQFVHEPFAALYGYLRALPNFKQKLAELEGQLILVFDWGGGTLDLTLCKIQKGMLVQIQNQGDNTIGGDEFDNRLVRFAKNKHIEQYGLANLDNELPHANSKLIGSCERTKKNLSIHSNAHITVAHYLKSDGPEHTLEVSFSRDQLIKLTKDIVDEGMNNIERILEAARVNPASIALCLATGGMVQMPYIRERLLERFDPGRVPLIPKSDQVISQGAAWIAHDEIGLCLAKPFEVLLADDDYSTIIEEQSQLPFENQVMNFGFDAYCADPRDGFAKFQFSRPLWPGRKLAGDPRRTYTTLLVKVDGQAKPLRERIRVDVNIDHDFVATVIAKAMMAGDTCGREIHDLEFALEIGKAADRIKPINDKKSSLGKQPVQKVPVNPISRSHMEGAIKLRSNIVLSPNAIDLIPGDFDNQIWHEIQNANPLWQLTPRQHDEKMYYIPCSICRRTIHEINLHGCEQCRPGSSMATQEARRQHEKKIQEIRQLEDKMNGNNASLNCYGRNRPA